MNETEYRNSAAEKGYAAPVLKVWEAGLFNDTHTHDVSLYLFIQDGQMSLDVETADGLQKTTCWAGDTIEVPAGIVHTERVGADGVTFLVARR